MTKIIRYCVLEEEHEGENIFKIHRPFPFGNPYTHISNKQTKALVVVKSKEEAVALYEHYFDKMLLTDKNFKEEWNRLINAYEKYDTIYLGCYCKADAEFCHANIIIKKLNQFLIKNLLK